MIHLNFPSFQPKFKRSTEGTPMIYDVIRKMFVIITPEEWVRQHIIHWLINQIGVPAINISVEKKLTVNGRTKRYDILVVKKGQADLLIECKAPEIKLTNETCAQVANYNKVLSVPQIMISNGLDSHLFAFSQKEEKYIPFPEYSY